MFKKKNHLYAGIIMLSVLISNAAFAMCPPPTFQSLFNRIWGSTKKTTKKVCFSPFKWCIRRTKKEINKQLPDLTNNINHHANIILDNAANKADIVISNAENRVNNINHNVQDNFNTLIWMGIFGTAAIVTTYYLTKYICKYLEKKSSNNKKQSASKKA